MPNRIDIQENIILAPFTTFKIGGPARFFCEVKNEEDLLEALNYAKKNNLEYFILGGGSNILVNDAGFNGLVIKIVARNVKHETHNPEPLVECWAGDSLASLVNLAVDNSLMGMEWAAGIPGSVGGAVRGNAGAFGGCMSDAIEEVRVLEIVPIQTRENPNYKLQITNYRQEDCNLSYRNSVFKEKDNLIILSAILKLEKGNQEKIKVKMKEIIEKRAEKQPMGFSAGSFFENPVVENRDLIEKFENSVGTKCKDNKLPAGWLIYEAGMKGKKIGAIQVSEKHANFVVNNGGGRAEDVVILASLIKQQIRMKLGVQLREEVKYVGF